MRILLINNYHYPKGGADKVYFNTAQLLRQYGHEVFFFSTRHPDNHPSDEEAFFAENQGFREASLIQKIKKIPSFVYNKDAYEKLLVYLDEIRPDVAHIHLFMGGLSTSILHALREKKIPVVHTAHDYRMICPSYLFKDGKGKVCERCRNKFYAQCIIHRCSDNNLAQSTMLALDAYHRRYRVDPVDLIDRFIFVSRFSMNKHLEFEERFRTKAIKLYNFHPELPQIKPTAAKGEYFLFYGRLSREKGLSTLIEAARRASIPLKVVGTGPLADQYQGRPLPDIEFLGFQKGEALWDLVRGASFVIVPSECYENNPLTIVEAYSFGKPVIGSRLGGIPEIIEEGKTGFCFESGNPDDLAQVITKARKVSAGDYQLMSERARKFAEKHFSPEAHYDHLMRIYSYLAKKETAKPAKY